MRCIFILTALWMVPAYAQQPDAVQSAYILSLQLQRSAVAAQDIGQALAVAKTQAEQNAAVAAYWHDACQSTEGCGTPTQVPPAQVSQK